jgi:DNA-binding transcriptional LysR family regulator
MDLLAALGTFTRISETGSFSAVAREQNASHSAVTRLIGQLEEHFGVRLFHRTTRRLTLTEDGQDLLGYARQVMEAAEEMEGALGRHRSEPVGVVRVGTPVAVGLALAHRLPVLLKRYPGLSLELVISDHPGNMIEQRLDVAVMGTEPTDASLISRVVGSFGRIAIASPAYLEQHGAPTTPQDLRQHACLVHDAGPDSARWRFGPKEDPIEVDVSGPLRANNSAVVQRAAVAGLGIARLSQLQVADDLRTGRLYRLLPDHEPERFQVYLVYPSRRHIAPRVRVAIDFVVEEWRRVLDRADAERMWGANDSTWLV